MLKRNCLLYVDAIYPRNAIGMYVMESLIYWRIPRWFTASCEDKKDQDYIFIYLFRFDCLQFFSMALVLKVSMFERVI